MDSLQNDRSVVIEPADIGFTVVIQEGTYYLKEAERQITYKKSYEEIRITKKEKVDLVEKSNKVFSNLRTNYVITENETTILGLILKKQFS